MKGAAERSYRTRFLLKSHATTFAHSASVSSVMPPVTGDVKIVGHAVLSS